MDGPNTNLKFLECLQKERSDNELSGLVDIGSCNLHTVHGCLADGVKASGWNLKKLFKGAYFLFHDTAARREDYFTLTGSEEFPFQFIVTRWVDACRLISIWPNTLKIYDFWEGLSKSKRPKSKSYKNVLVHIDDKLIIAKMHFFCYMAGILEPYLTCHQGESPLVPFMDGDLRRLFKSVLAVVVKPKVLENCKTGLDMIRLDLDDEKSLITPKKIHLGFAAEDEIAKLGGQTDTEAVDNLKQGAFKFVLAMLEKLQNRNPLSSSIVRNSVVFNPKSVVSQTSDKLNTRMKHLIAKLVGLQKIQSGLGDKALEQYRDFLTEFVPLNKEKFVSFKRDERRLEEFFFKVLQIHSTFHELGEVMKVIFTLSASQASVERGFNDNNLVLKDNQKNGTIVARRFIKDYLNKNGFLPHTVPITTHLVKSYRMSRQRYQQYLDKEREKKGKEEKSGELKKIENQIESLEAEVIKSEEMIADKKSQSDDMMFKAESQSNMLLVVQSCALKHAILKIYIIRFSNS